MNNEPKPVIKPNAAGTTVLVKYPCGARAMLCKGDGDNFCDEWFWTTVVGEGVGELVNTGRSVGSVDRAITAAWCDVRPAPDAIPSAEAADLEGVEELERGAFVKRLRSALKARTGRSWSVKGSTGTSWCWIDVCAPPARKHDHRMTSEDESLLAAVMNERRGISGNISIPPTRGHRTAALAAALGIEPIIPKAEHAWD